MKKTGIIAASVMVALLAIAAFFVFGGKNKSAEDDMGAKTGTERASKAEEAKKGLFDFLSAGSGVKCSVEDQNGKYTVFSSGKKVKIEGIDYFSYGGANAQPEKGSMINDGEWAYMWSSKKGTKFNLKEMESFSEGSGAKEQSESSDWSSWAKSMEASGAKYDCKTAMLSDSDFTPPSDVAFQDLGEMLKQLKAMEEQLKGVQIPNVGQ